MRLAAYAGTSTVLATAVIIRAFHQRANFYSACVYLAQSNACLMILTNLLLLCVGFVMLALQRLFYGSLRPIEIEQLYEKAWFAITETCLAMTIFREEVGGWFLVMFVSLLVGKVWGWIGEGRVEVLEQQPPANPRLFHARLSFSLLVSVFFDICMLHYSVLTVLRMARPNMMVMFAFEFAVLAVSSTSTAARYAISLTEAFIIRQQTLVKIAERRDELRLARIDEADQREAPADGSAAVPEEIGEEEVDEMDIDVPGWEDKGRWIFYLDLTTDFFKLVIYISFFSILLTFYGLPIHIMRDVFLTTRSFCKRIADFLRYRNATRDMNERYPDATGDEIAREDTCIICREEMRPWQQPNNEPAPADGANVEARPARRAPSPIDERSRPKKLPCGHILHFGCLRSWLERQQICPTCRRPVLVTDTIRAAQNQQARDRFAEQAMAMGGQPQPNNLHGNNGANGVAGQGAQNNGRIINFGPFRIGFGIGQANLVQNLAQRMNNGQPGQFQGQQGNVPGRQPIGFGIGFGRQAPANQNTAAQFSPSDVSTQLHRIELQIMQQINDLRATADQMHLVRALQGELARLRIAQGNGGNNAAGGAMGLPALPQATNMLTNPIRPLIQNSLAPQQPQPVQAFGPNPERPAMGAGHQDLPAGITLPEGWSVLPLQRIEQGLSQAQTGSSPVPLATSASQSGAARSDILQTTPNDGNTPALDTVQTNENREVSDTGSTMRSTSYLTGPQSSHQSHETPSVDPLTSSSSQSINGAAHLAPSQTPSPSLPSDHLPQLAAQHPIPSNTSSAAIDTPSSNNGNVSSDPPPVSIPSWGSAAEQKPAVSVDGGEHDSDDNPFPTTNHRQAIDKGKGRAATVEDVIDEVD
ncbi:MAG: E3 ubiquitin-protein ligase hrd1 [Pycnora praestabilis]|nr:MAG: E3 ubiquitin-protein ligase hrd1 [Pycnora praestabilis]